MWPVSLILQSLGKVSQKSSGIEGEPQQEKHSQERTMVMEKKKGLTQVCWGPAVFLLFLGICLWFHPTAYSKTYIGGFPYAQYAFLQAGDYVLEITYADAPAGGKVTISSQALVDEQNRQGVILAEEAFPETAGVISLAFHLEQGTRDIVVSHDAGEGLPVFDQITLQSIQLLDRDNYFLGGCMILSAVFVFFFGRKCKEPAFRIPLLLAGIGIAASLPLMSDALKWGHDIPFHLARIEGLYQGLRSGAFPVRINPIQLEEFGYLSAAMYPQLFLYPVALLRFLGVSTMLCYKILLFGTSIATAFICHYSVKGITKSEKTGLIGAVLYTFAAYRLTDLYTRAAVGEALAMVFFPLVAWGIYELLWGEKKKWYLLALGITGVLQSHILSMEMCLVFLVAVSVFWLCTGRKTFRGDRLKRIARGFLAAGMVVVWNISLWLPILFYSREGMQVYGSKNDLSLSAAYFSQMFSFFAEAAGPNQVSGNTRGEMPITVGGILLVCGVLLVIVLLCKKREEYTSVEKIGYFCLCMGGIALVLSSFVFPWQQLQKIEWLNRLITPIEFVWRFLAVASFFLCVAGAAGIVAFQERFGGAKWLMPVIMAMLACSTGYYFDRISYTLEDMADKMVIAGINDSSTSEYLYEESVLTDFNREDSVIQCNNGSEIEYSDYHKNGTFLSVRVTPKRVEPGAKLLFPLYGYTGYQVNVNGEPVEWERLNSRVACDLPVGESLIEICYKGPTAFAVADIIGWAAVMGSAGFAVVKKRMAER